MDYTVLGRTGLKVSVAGLGCGGFSRLGLGAGRSEAEAVAVVREALDLGVNLLDTAAVYETEGVVGQAIKGRSRDGLVIATKAIPQRDLGQHDAARVIASLDNSLKLLGTDFVDVFQLHGVAPSGYEHCRDVLVPALKREQAKGKFRHLGITETSPNDHEHKMLQRGIPEGHWDTVMLGFNLMHQNALKTVFPLTKAHNVGTLLMFVVRQVFSDPALLAATLKDLKLTGGEKALDFLLHPAGASTVTDAAYRFVRHTAGVDVVLFGTGSREHLRTNIASLLKPPLPEADLRQIESAFGHLVGVGLVRPPGR